MRAAVYSLVGMVVLLLLAMLASCKTTRYVTVPEYHSEVVHDTDSVVRRDVVRDTSWMTIREVDSAEWIMDLADECADAEVAFFDKRKAGWLLREFPD